MTRVGRLEEKGGYECLRVVEGQRGAEGNDVVQRGKGG